MHATKNKRDPQNCRSQSDGQRMKHMRPTAKWSRWIPLGKLVSWPHICHTFCLVLGRECCLRWVGPKHVFRSLPCTPASEDKQGGQDKACVQVCCSSRFQKAVETRPYIYSRVFFFFWGGGGSYENVNSLLNGCMDSAWFKRVLQNWKRHIPKILVHVPSLLVLTRRLKATLSK